MPCSLPAESGSLVLVHFIDYHGCRDATNFGPRLLTSMFQFYSSIHPLPLDATARFRTRVMPQDIFKPIFSKSSNENIMINDIVRSFIVPPMSRLQGIILP